MALIRLDHTPETTKVNTPLNIILPGPGQMKGVPVRERKVLYLLHGLSDDGSAWQRFTNIEMLAVDYGLVVVMPSVGRSFYTDMPNGQNYFSYITEELPQYLKDVFGLAPEREDTLIAGLSMGGYGAMKCALLHSELYKAAASFSGVLSVAMIQNRPDDPRQPEFSMLFGDLDKVQGSPHDPAVWLKQAAAHPEKVPSLYISCGRQDDLYPLSKMFFAACQSAGFKAEYHEEDAKHEWYFWGREIARFLKAELGELP
jgi:S-formylglutathione hydrolase FrmB